MLSKLTALFRRPDNRVAGPAVDAPFAVAVLLVEAARVDEVYDARERSIIDAALTTKFGLDAAGAAAQRAGALRMSCRPRERAETVPLLAPDAQPADKAPTA